MALVSFSQDDFSFGIYRGRKAPANSVYDAVNALINDEGLLIKRGGSAYKSGSAAGSSLVGLGVIPTANPAITLFWRSGNFYKLDSDDSTLVSLSTTHVPAAFVRGATGATTTGGSWVAPKSTNTVVFTDGTGGGTGTATITPAASVDFVAAVGDRAIYVDGSKVWFTAPGGSVPAADEYHLLPFRARGAEGLDVNTCLVFTAGGIWAIGNMALDPVDAFGNIQHLVQQVSADLVLWGDLGVTRYKGTVVVPALDDIYLFGLGIEPVIVSERIRPLYRGYVAAGYKPGFAAVHRGHLVLPVLNDSNVVQDVLVCRLDREAAWTRWSGHAAGPGFMQRVGSTPLLLGISGERLTNLNGCFDPTTSNAQDADATTPSCTITTRDYPIGQQPGFVESLRARYELTDDGSGGTAAPTVAVAVSSDQDAGVFTTLTELGEQGGGTGGAVSSGAKYMWWKVRKRRERIRFRVTQTGAAGPFIFRSLELLIRPQGRQ